MNFLNCKLAGLLTFPELSEQILNFRKSVMSIKFLPAILGQKWLCHFYGRLAFLVSFCWKTPMPIKFLLLGGVLVFFRRGGWKCQFYFYGRGDFFREFPGFVRLEIPKPWKIQESPSPDSFQNCATPQCGWYPFLFWKP